METITGYAVARRVNQELKALGLKEIPPQMVYNYISNNLIKTVEKNGQKLVTVAHAQEWQAKFVAKRVEKAKTA